MESIVSAGSDCSYARGSPPWQWEAAEGSTCLDRTGIEIRKTGFQEVVQISELIAIGLIPNNSDPGDGPVPSPTVTEAEDATIAASAIVDYAQRQLASGPFSTCYHHR